MLQELRTFLAVAAAGSIQGATRSLPLTQSAITRQVQRLEAMLDCRLLDRSIKPPRLTRDGARLRDRGRALLESVEAFRSSFGPAAEPDGMLCLGVAHAALDWRGAQAVARTVAEVTAAYPRLTVRATAGWTPALLGEVRAGSMDAALVIGRPGGAWPEGITARPVAQDVLVAAAAPGRGIDRRTRFDALLQRSWVLNPDGCGYRALLMARAAARGGAIRIAAEIQGASLQRELVAAGLGVGLVPDAVALAWIAAGDRVVRIRPDAHPMAVAATLVARAEAGVLARPIDTVHAALARAFGLRRRGAARR